MGQARSKSNQIQPNRAKAGQRISKKTAWFSLDFLVRIEPFQGLARTPSPEKHFLAPFSRSTEQIDETPARARNAALLTCGALFDAAQVIHRFHRQTQAGAAPNPSRRGAKPKSMPTFDKSYPLPF
jgi:hypothetical protein